MEKIEFSCPPDELSCIIGNLFQGLDVPCDLVNSRSLAISGRTNGGGIAGLIIYKDRCTFFGNPQELESVRIGQCLERKCGNG